MEREHSSKRLEASYKKLKSDARWFILKNPTPEQLAKFNDVAGDVIQDTSMNLNGKEVTVVVPEEKTEWAKKKAIELGIKVE